MKFLLWAVLIFAVIWVLRSKTRSASSDAPAARPPSSHREIETMVRCAHCGTYIPLSEAVLDASRTAFCSAEHRQLHAPR